MAQIGGKPFSLRAEGSWRGITTQTPSDMGDRRFAKLIDCYVSSDGVEIRTRPGFKCVYDFSGARDPVSDIDALGGTGFLRNVIDGNRPVWTTVGGYRELRTDLGSLAQHWAWARPRHIHAFKFLRGRLVLIGESGFMREPIMNDVAGAFVAIDSWSSATNCVLTLSDDILLGGDGGMVTGTTATALGDSTKTGASAWATNQWAGYTVYTEGNAPEAIISNTGDTLVVASWSVGQPAGSSVYRIVGTAVFNSLRPGDVVFIEGLTGSGSTALNGKFHHVLATSGATVTLSTDTSGVSAGSGQQGLIDVVRPAGTAYANYPLDEFDTTATDDPESLTVWVGMDESTGRSLPDVTSLLTNCYPSHVFNRQRDYGDVLTPGFERQEGSHAGVYTIAGTTRILSRRRRKSLPFRVNPDLANGRILLGAPGYGCVFQVPAIASIDPPYQDTLTATDRGIAYWPNSLYDRPRSAGIPKAMMRVDIIRNSASESEHFFGTGTNSLIWGGFERLLRESLYVESGTVTAIDGAGFGLSFTDSTKTWIANEWDLASPSPYREGYFVFASIQDSQENSPDTGPGFRIVEGNGAFTDTIDQSIAGAPTPSPPWAAIGNTYKLFAWVAELVDDGVNTKLSFTNAAGSVSRKTFTPKEFKDRQLRCVNTQAGSSSPAYRSIIDNGDDWIIISGTLPFQIEPVTPLTTPPRLGSWIEIADQDTRFGTYKFAIAYRDTATGEVGPLSEPVEITVEQGDLVDSGIGIRLFIMHPGYLMSECGALQVELYRTKRDDDAAEPAYFFDSVVPMEAMQPTAPHAPAGGYHSTVFGVQPSTSASAPYNHYVAYDVPYKTDAELEEAGSRYVPSGLERMPAGAGCVRTGRGITVYGGRTGDAGSSDEMVRSLLTTTYTGEVGLSFTRHDQLTLRGGVTTLSATYTLDGPWLCANAYIPSSYAGLGQVFGTGLFPFPAQSAVLNKQLNNETDGGTFSVFDYQRFQIDNTPFDKESIAWTGHAGIQAFLILPVGRFEWSIVGQPTFTPATNIGFVDAESDEDIQAIGTWGGAFVLATRRNAYILQYAEDVRPTPDLAHPECGGIAANTMVEFDSGTAWMGDRGPIALTAGGAAQIGQDLERDFFGRRARYLRDSKGLMRHAWSCHDPERGLVYFGVFANRNVGTANEVTINFRGTDVDWDAASDEAKSRFPCDEILVLSYRTGAWSVWVPPAGLEVLWMEREFDVAGVPRILMLCADWRIYALDDEFNDTNKDPIVRSATNRGSSGALTFTGAVGSDAAALGAGENFVRVGMEVLLTRSQRPIAFGAVTSFTATSVTVSWEDAVTWEVGDQVHIGVRSMQIETNWFSTTGHEDPGSASAIHVRYSTSSLVSRDPAFASQPAAIKAQAWASKSPGDIDGVERPETGMSGDQDEIGPWDPLGYSQPDENRINPTRKLTKGRPVGQSLKVRLRAVGGAQVKISDIVVE